MKLTPYLSFIFKNTFLIELCERCGSIQVLKHFKAKISKNLHPNGVFLLLLLFIILG